MLDGIDALVALASFGTVSEAATRLRLTQSAVSKRIQHLQAELGFRIVEPDGRRLRLTARATHFLARARPLVAELRGLTREAVHEAAACFSLALADSIASSWGPAVVSQALASAAGVTVELHSHRSVLVLESVRLGRYDLGLCTESATVGDLWQHPVCDEPLVFVHARLAAKAARGAPLITIEPTSATWRAIAPALRTHHAALLGGQRIAVESFGAALQMVKAGFGNGLVPLGLALELPRPSYRVMRGVTRRIALQTRKTLAEAPGVIALRDGLTLAAQQRLGVLGHDAHRRAPRHQP